MAEANARSRGDVERGEVMVERSLSPPSLQQRRRDGRGGGMAAILLGAFALSCMAAFLVSSSLSSYAAVELSSSAYSLPLDGSSDAGLSTLQKTTEKR